MQVGCGDKAVWAASHDDASADSRSFIQWDPSIRIVALGWTSEEQLAVVLEEGIVRLYTLLSPCPAPPPRTSSEEDAALPVEATASCYHTSYALGTDATDTGVTSARIWAHGLVALTGAGRFVEWKFPARDAEEGSWASRVPVPTLLPALVLPSGTAKAAGSSTSSAAGPPEPPSAWDIRPPGVSASGLLELLVSPAATSDGGTLLAIDSLAGCTDLRLTRGPFHAVRPSPNGALLALLTSDAKLWVVSADLQRSLSEFDVGASDAFDEARGTGLGGTGVVAVEWCGDNSVVLSSDSEVLMVGPFGDALR